MLKGLWLTVINIISIFIVLAVLSVATTDFEVVVLSVLVLTYLGLSSFFSLYAVSQLEFAETNYYQHKQLQMFIKKTTKLSDQEQEEFEEIQQKKKQRETKYVIGAVFQGIIYLIVVFILLAAIF